MSASISVCHINAVSFAEIPGNIIPSRVYNTWIDNRIMFYRADSHKPLPNCGKNSHRTVFWVYGSVLALPLIFCFSLIPRANFFYSLVGTRIHTTFILPRSSLYVAPLKGGPISAIKLLPLPLVLLFLAPFYWTLAYVAGTAKHVLWIVSFFPLTTHKEQRCFPACRQNDRVTV